MAFVEGKALAIIVPAVSSFPIADVSRDSNQAVVPLNEMKRTTTAYNVRLQAPFFPLADLEAYSAVTVFLVRSLPYIVSLA